MRKAKITCGECNYTSPKGLMIFESRKDLEVKIKDGMIICTNCEQKKNFKVKWVNK